MQMLRHWTSLCRGEIHYLYNIRFMTNLTWKNTCDVTTIIEKDSL